MPILHFKEAHMSFEGSISLKDAMEQCVPVIAKKAIAAKVNGTWVDLTETITEETHVTLLTENDPEGLEVIRHSTAHLLAQAVQQLFPSAQVTIGPVIENGFYYDFAFERGFTEKDLELIEAKMHELVQKNIPIQRKVVSREEAIQFFTAKGEQYKVQIVQELPAGETISLYEQAEFTDLCRGPHVPSTGYLKAFKLTKVSGAYWRGDSKNEMLQRIYGIAFSNEEELNKFWHLFQEAEKRDHRKIGKTLDLFHVQEEAPGMVFWHPNGWTIYREIKYYITQLLTERGYQEVNTPQVLDKSLWERSGHWEKFRQNMFTTRMEEREFAIKPMNCPGHIQIFNQSLKSYRDLPLRFSEFGSCHRCEPGGSLHGIMRVRGFVQDDAHIFCTEDQIQSEVANFLDLLFLIYQDFGFDEVLIKLATRPANRIGSDEIWDRSEKMLEQALNDHGIAWELNPGEGAFYGPKLEFSLRDSIGRVWQCGTIQVDFSMPERLGASYITEDGSKKTPVMLHRAVLGSIERFIGILIENYAGMLPLWLSPVQVMVMNITDRQSDYVREVVRELSYSSIRAKFDLRNEKIGYKIREHTLMCVPYLVVLGDRERDMKTVSVRTKKGEDLGSMSLTDLIERLQREVAQRGRNKLEG